MMAELCVPFLWGKGEVGFEAVLVFCLILFCFFPPFFPKEDLSCFVYSVHFPSVLAVACLEVSLMDKTKQ